MAQAKTKPAAQHEDAIAMLTADHAEVKKMFKEYEKLKEGGSDDDKEALVEDICTALTIHMQLEEDIFYPAAKAAIKDDDLMDEAEVEHTGARDLIAQLETMAPDEPLYDARVKVLGEQIDHHVKEEQGEMFPKVRKAKLDLVALGGQMKALRTELEESLV
jgi:DUF438 domain-containing protein